MAARGEGRGREAGAPEGSAIAMSDLDTDAIREVALGRLGLNRAEHDLLQEAADEIDRLRERLRRASEELREMEKSRLWREATAPNSGEKEEP